MHLSLRVTFAIAFLAAAISAQADVSLPALISDNMVLQQKATASVWGTAAPNEKVTVKIATKAASAIADNNGSWSVNFENLKPGGPYEMTISGSNTLTIHNVAVGEVWVCSGQSNMEFRVSRAQKAQEEAAEAEFPMIRMFTVAKKVADDPQGDCIGKWEVCDSKSVLNFSAVGYFFGRDIHQGLKVPVGMIHSSWGGTPAESWTPKAALADDQELKPISESWQKTLEEYPEKKADYDAKFAAWKEASAKAKAAGEPIPRVPSPPKGRGTPYQLSGLFNGMIAPLIPYSIRGAIWYQGESNADRAKEYRKLFPTMIRSWRKAWAQDEFPFLFVQLANYGNGHARDTRPMDSQWAELREAQTMALKLPKTGMAVAIDIGNETDIHPTNKQEVGRRLALVAEAIVYGRENVEFAGPTFSSMKIVGGIAQVTYTHTAGRLVAKGGDALKGFAIAGEDKKFVWADAKIEGQKVIVRSEQVPKPVAVRYDWADSPDGNLYNKADLPAAPFRTDAWEKTTSAPPMATPTLNPTSTPAAAIESAPTVPAGEVK